MNVPFDVVTGGAGFIGSHLCEGLIASGRTVRVVDNLSSGKREHLSSLLREFPGRADFCELDIRDLEGLKRCFQGAEVVYHQAAVPSVQRSVEDPLETGSANIEGTLKVFLAAREAGARKVVYASSSSVYGDSEVLPKSEDMQPRPLSPYAVTKYAGELYGNVFSSVFDLPAVGLRYFNVFGPRQDPQSEYAAVIPRFISRMLAGDPPVIYGDGEQSRDFTYVSNVVAANLRAAASPSSGISVNIACGERFTLNQLVAVLNELLGTNLRPVYEPARRGDVRHSQAEVSQAREKIGFEPHVPFREGLRLTVESFRARQAAGLGRKYL